MTLMGIVGKGEEAVNTIDGSSKADDNVLVWGDNEFKSANMSSEIRVDDSIIRCQWKGEAKR